MCPGITLEHVLFVPQLNCNLISVSKLIDDSLCHVRFTDSLCAIQDHRSGSLIGGGERVDGLYYFRRIPAVCAIPGSGVSNFELWHRRLGHPSDKVVKLLPGVSNSAGKKSLNKACEICPQAKQSRNSFPSSDSRASRVFELIHCDLWGPYRTPSTCDAHYFLTLVDDYSRGVWVYLLNNKTEVYTSFCSFFAMIKCQFGVTTKYVRSDNGTEFKHMIPYFNDNGMIFQTSCVGTPQQNGRVERKHQHILNVARALMFQGDLPITLWGECVLGAVYLINRTPTHILENKTPYEILFNKEPNYEELRVFGCLCFAHDQKAKGDKFAPRSRKCVFVDYPNATKGWKLYDVATGEIFVSRDVLFYENEFPFTSHGDSSSHNNDVPLDANNMVDMDFLDDLENVLDTSDLALAQDTTHHSSTISSQPATATAATSAASAAPSPETAANEGVQPAADSGSSPIDAPQPTDASTSYTLDRGTRQRRPPGWHQDYVAILYLY